LTIHEASDLHIDRKRGWRRKMWVKRKIKGAHVQSHKDDCAK
jgi:hypothetical protein